MGLVDAAVDDGDANAFALGGIPWAVCGAAGDVVAKAADLLNGPALGSGVEGVVGWRCGDDGRRGEDGTVGGEFANGGEWGGGLSGAVDADGGRIERLETKALGSDDAIVEDVVDVGLGGEMAECGGVIFLCCGLDGSDAEVLVAPGEMSAGGGDASLGVAGDGGIAIEDEVTVGSDAGGVDLSTGEAREEEYKDNGPAADEAADQTHDWDGKGWRLDS